MKALTVGLAVAVIALFGNFAHADFRTQDNVNYIVTLVKDMPEKKAQKCMEKVCAVSRDQGTGVCELIFDFGGLRILSANLTNYGASQVAALSCVRAVELDRENRPLPSVGRGN